MKLWGGRFSKNTDSLVDDFNSSISFDARLYKHDILGSIAHATMLGKQNIISKSDADTLVSTLRELLIDIESGNVHFSVDAEDIHLNIEKLLIERIGDIGKRLHTGRSRNDQVALDLRLYLADEITQIIHCAKALNKVILSLAEKYITVIMPGYTHLQKAQPILFSHHLMAYFEMIKRDIQRLTQTRERTNVSPLGSGALAGTTYPLDREYVAELLHMNGVTQNSLDGVSDRDFAIETIFDISLIMMHLSRFSEEIILWSSGEFAFIELDDAYSTGSSIMPQKKNPDVAELTRGKTGRVYGDLTALLTLMKGIPLAYNKDMQEDKEAVFDAVDTILMVLPVFSNMIETMAIREKNMVKGAKGGFTNATDAADYLVRRGLPFRDAHKVIGEMVAHCIAEDKSIEELTLEEFKKFSNIIEDDIFQAIALDTCVNQRNITGATATNQVIKQIYEGKELYENE